MEQTWTYQNSSRSAPIHPGVQLFVDLIGIDKTADLLLACGGSRVSSGQLRSKAGSLVVSAVGEEASRIIGSEFVGGDFACPVGRSFLVRYLFAKGKKQNEIARTLHMHVSSVSRNLMGYHPDEDDDAPLSRRRVRR